MKLNYEVKIVKVNNIFMVLEQKQRRTIKEIHCSIEHFGVCTT